MKMTKKEQRESLQRNEAKWSEVLMPRTYVVIAGLKTTPASSSIERLPDG